MFRDEWGTLAHRLAAVLTVVYHTQMSPRTGRSWRHATRAELLRRLDRVENARAAYDRALQLVHSEAERRFLERRLAELQG